MKLFIMEKAIDAATASEEASCIKAYDPATSSISELASTPSAMCIAIISDKVDAPSEMMVKNEMHKLHNLEAVTIFPTKIGQQQFVAPDLSISDLIKFVHQEADWPVAALVVSAKIVAEAQINFNAPGLIAQLYAFAISRGYEINLSDSEIYCSDRNAIRLSKAELAQVLRVLIENSPIEEMFPHHPWTDHPEESAAASYHELASLFLAMEDIQAAEDCINCGDQLEDSPRGLALKGAMALCQGETLAAVANLVSSLQEYERRKKQTNHYLTFQPQDLSVVNSSLQHGLEALNNRDNEAAASYFARAISEFDPLFKSSFEGLTAGTAVGMVQKAN